MNIGPFLTLNYNVFLENIKDIKDDGKYFLNSPLNIENPLVLGGGLGTSPGQATVPGGFLARFRSILSLSVPRLAKPEKDLSGCAGRW